MDDSDPKPAARTGRGWLRSHARALAVVAALLLLYTLAGFVLVPRLARNAIVQYVQKDLGRRVSLGQLRFNPFTFTVEIHQFALSEADDPDIQAALHDNFEAFVEFVADTLEEGKARGIVKRDVDTRLIAWQFLGIGMTLDMMNMLGFKDEMDRRRADMWGRVYLETVRRKDGHRPPYATAEGTPMRAPAGSV